jgi:hypothetical protein
MQPQVVRLSDVPTPTAGETHQKQRDKTSMREVLAPIRTITHSLPKIYKNIYTKLTFLKSPEFG